VGVSYSPEEFAAKMERTIMAVDTAATASTVAAAALIKGGIETVAPATLRNVGKGAKLTVRSVVTKSTAVLTGMGPWGIIEGPTKAHRIGPHKYRGGRRGGGVVLPDGGVRSSVQHPGTKGKHPFQQGAEATIPAAAKVYGVSVRTAIGAAF
jgi:hypothetical protein